MKHKGPAWLILMVITAAAGLLLGVTNVVTAPIIERQSLAAADAGRAMVFPDAEAFQPMTLAEGAAVDSCYEALKGDAVAGHVGTATVKGYGGNIEITIGLDLHSVITGIAVGGDDFSESPGLGALTREPAFTSQFVQATAPVKLGEGIDSVTGASISSGAVVSGVNRIVKYMENLGKDASDTDPYHNAVDESYGELPGDGTVERAFRAADGRFAVFAGAKGFHGDIHALVLTDAAGTITRVVIDETSFNETAGLGERVLEEDFLQQFVGLSGVIGVTPGGYGAGGGDAVTAATAEAGEEADAVTAATAEAGEEADAVTAATAETGEEADAVTAATAEAGEEADAATAATAEAGEEADAVTAATAEAGEEADEEADAVGSASVVIEKIEGANADIDGVSGATYSSAAVAKAVNAALAFIQGYLGTVAS